MTGIDCLREELEMRGLSKAQIESKVVAVVLDVVANSGNKYAEMWKHEQGESKKLRDLERGIRRAERELDSIQKQIAIFEAEENRARESRKHCEDYIDQFNSSLLACETAPGRDAMRTAQVFVNSVSVDTKYDNTAYIIGLAAILSKGGLNAIQELKKINKKLPDISEWTTI